MHSLWPITKPKCKLLQYNTIIEKRQQAFILRLSALALYPKSESYVLHYYAAIVLRLGRKLILILSNLKL